MVKLACIGLVFLVALIVTYATVPFSKWLAFKIGALDYPDKRRVNTVVMPRCGGVALYLGLLAGCSVLYVGCSFFDWRAFDLYTIETIDPVLLLCGVSVMFAIGLVDDIVQLRASTKFTFQIIAAVIVVNAGVSVGAIRTFDGSYMELGWLDNLISIAYLIVFTNVINLVDGLDGLASGITAICASGLLYMVWMRGSFTLTLVCAALIAVCLAFLHYNFHPASVFMGDSGALLLGFVLGIISVTGVVRTQSLIIMIVPLVIAAVPILDTISAILRRWSQRVPIGQADKEHIHHRLIDTGMGQVRSVAVLYILTAAATVAGCALDKHPGSTRLAILAVFALVSFFITWKLGLSKKVTDHYYRNKGKTGLRLVHQDPANKEFTQLPAESDAASSDAVEPLNAAGDTA